MNVLLLNVESVALDAWWGNAKRIAAVVENQIVRATEQASHAYPGYFAPKQWSSSAYPTKDIEADLGDTWLM